MVVVHELEDDLAGQIVGDGALNAQLRGQVVELVARGEQVGLQPGAI